MAGRLITEKVQLKTLQSYHHQVLNTFFEHETLIESIINRPGFVGASPVGFLSLLARRPTLKPKDLEEALLVDKTLLRACAFRGSLFLVPTEDYPIYFRAFNQMLQQRGLLKLEELGINQTKIYRFFEIIEQNYKNFPLSILEISLLLFKVVDEEKTNLVVQKLCDMGLLVRATTKGFRGNDFSYALLEKWVPELSLKHDNPETARSETVKRYLRAYGPCLIEDICYWTGFSMLQVQRSLAFIKKEVTRFNIEGYKEDLFGLKESIDLIRKKFIQSDDIQFLPPWDPYTFGWKTKKRLCDKEFLPFVFDERQNATSVIVNNGKIIGVWQFKDTSPNLIEYHVFPKYQHQKALVNHKIGEWALLMTDITLSKEVVILEKELQISLKDRGPGSFLWPLGKGKEQVPSPMDRRNRNILKQKYLDNDYLIRSNSAQI